MFNKIILKKTEKKKNRVEISFINIKFRENIWKHIIKNLLFV